MTSSLRLIEADAFEAWLARCPLPASLLQEYSVARTQEGFRVNCGWFVPAERLGAVPAAPPVAATTAAPAPAVPPSPRSPPNQPNQPNQSSVTEDSEATVAKLQAAIAANSSAAAAPPKDDTVARVQEAISERGVSHVIGWPVAQSSCSRSTTRACHHQCRRQSCGRVATTGGGGGCPGMCRQLVVCQAQGENRAGRVAQECGRCTHRTCHVR